MTNQKALRYVLKIGSSRLRKARWNLTLTLEEARRNDEVIALGDSQVLRWIDELNGNADCDAEIARIKAEIRWIRKQPHSIANRRSIRGLYAQLDKLQFKPDYMCLVIEKTKDFYRACKGFTLNGMRFFRLLGTNGGVKNETIVFASERVIDTLRSRIDNGRDHGVPQIPAKLEAYRALACSGSTPVSMPNGILVVNDCETRFTEDVITINDEEDGEPVMRYEPGTEIVLDESDGYGLMLPSLAERWSQELGLDYVASGMNTRLSYEKGMVFTFDFLDFADSVAGTRIVKDAWGNEVDVSNVELILTTSMLKLWNCYESIDHYLACCRENHYTFGIAKVCPKELESRRCSNYQFLNPIKLTDEQIDELIAPTVREIHDALSGDYRKAILFLKGMYLNERNMRRLPDDFAKAMMADERMFDDPHIKRRIYQMIRKRITEAKIGVISLHANYSIVCGDPYSLCQSVFGLPVTGLLKAGEVYNQYWADAGADRLACFRAPMTAANNIRIVRSRDDAEVRRWYAHMKTCTLFNSWDSAASALNGIEVSPRSE